VYQAIGKTNIGIAVPRPLDLAEGLNSIMERWRHRFHYSHDGLSLSQLAAC
jgi:hypothetical protein